MYYVQLYLFIQGYGTAQDLEHLQIIGCILSAVDLTYVSPHHPSIMDIEDGGVLRGIRSLARQQAKELRIRELGLAPGQSILYR
eukprot:COSAG05_NODE_325_length_11376_cov_31.743726_5_plen_84_part_00